MTWVKLDYAWITKAGVPYGAPPRERTHTSIHCDPRCHVYQGVERRSGTVAVPPEFWRFFSPCSRCREQYGAPDWFWYPEKSATHEFLAWCRSMT